MTTLSFRTILPRVLAAAVVVMSLIAPSWSADPPVAATWKPEKINEPTLPNAFRLHTKVISGGQPDGELAFAKLKELGVKTIISVDGARPEVELAKKYGLRYVHLPHGYDGVPE